MSSNTSHLEAHACIYRLLLKGIFDAHVLQPFELVTHVNTRNFTGCKMSRIPLSKSLIDFVTWNSTQHIHRPCIFFEIGASKAELLTLQIRGRPRLIRDSSTLISFWLLPVPLSCSTSHCHELGSSRTPSCQTTWKGKKCIFIRGGQFRNFNFPGLFCTSSKETLCTPWLPLRDASNSVWVLKQFPMSLNFSSYFEK